MPTSRQLTIDPTMDARLATIRSRTDPNSSSRMELVISDNGWEVTGMETAFKFGKMEPVTRVTGNITRRTAMELSGTCMATNMKENGSMTKLTAKAPIHMQMGPSTKAAGKTISNMAMVLKSGQMVLSIWGIMWRAASTGAGNTHGKMARSMTVSGIITRSMGLEPISGSMGASIRASGSITTCMGLGSIAGKTAAAIKENMLGTVSMVMVFTSGLMGESMMDSGRTDASTVRVSTGSSLIRSLREVCGSRAREIAGLKLLSEITI